MKKSIATAFFSSTPKNNRHFHSGFFLILICSFWFGQLSAQSERQIKGTVTDDRGTALTGVSVSLKGTSKGTVTNAAGSYSLTVAGGKGILVFSSASFVNKEISIGQSDIVDASLTPESKAMTEVVVTGYSRQSKRDVTGAVSTVSADVVTKSPVTDVGSVLQGRVAGVSVDDQGGPGETAVVRIRGFGSNGDNDPLYVIDGVQIRGGSNLINPNDIESITVLKDPSITSLYGAQGGNGVIVITTKTGKIGPPKVEYNSYLDWESSIKVPGLISPQQYADAYWGYLKNSGLAQTSTIYGSGPSPVLPDYIIERASGGALYVGANDPAADPSLYNLSSYRILKTNKTGTDWFNQILRQATSQSHQLTISGATDKSNYALGLNYLSNRGIVLGTYFNRYSFRVNTEFKPTKWFKIGENMEFAFSQGNNNISNHNPQGSIGDLYNRSPLIPLFDIAGNYSGPKGLVDSKAFHEGGNNPVYGQLDSKENSKGYSAGVIGSSYVDIEPIKGLVFETKIGFQFYPYTFRYFADTFPQNVFSSAINSFGEGNGWSTDWRWTNKVSYDLRINNIHKISAFIAYEARNYTFRYAAGTTPNLPYTIPSFLILGNGAPIDSLNVENTTSGSQDEAKATSVFGNVNYSLLDRYLFSFVLRRDGSSKFGPLNRYGNFPSYSVGWRISNESFMRGVGWINDLKLRAAVGSNGNDAIPSGLYVNQYNTDSYVSSYDISGDNTSAAVGLGLYQIGNPYIHWETNKTTNIGFDATVFKKFGIVFSWFNRQTKDLLAVPPFPGLQGDALAPFKNVMKFDNKGFELELTYSNKIGPVGYDLGFNVATYKNNVVYIDGDTSAHLDGDNYAPTHFSLTRSVVGRPVSSFFGYVQEGIFQSGDEYTKNGVTEAGLTAANAAGHFKFKDINHDGVINSADRTFIGSPHPKFSYGFNLDLNYSNFDLALFIQGVQGNKIFNYWRVNSVWPGAQGEGSLDTWSTTNTSAKLPIWNTDATEDLNPSSFFVEDGSYLRIKSLQLGFTFPKTKVFSKLRVYFQAYNLATFTKYTGIDPEISTGSATNAGVDFGGNYPLAKKFLVGVNLGF